MSFSGAERFTLEEVCSLITDGAHTSPKTVEEGLPMASVKDMDYFDINLNSCRKISLEDYEKLVKSGCRPLINDVLIAKDGSYMKYVNVVKEEKDVVLLSSIAILRPNKDKIDPMFLKYYLLTPVIRDDLEQGYVSGSVIRRIVLKDFKRFPLTLPILEEQKAIANILSSLDEKIELNNQMNKTLEEMAQALFKRWFVDFEFPDENGEPYKSSGGEMVDSELGMIPKGWEVSTLDNIIDIASGKRPPKKSPILDNEYMIPLIGSSSIMGYVPEPLLDEPILVIGRVGTHGVVQRFNDKVWPSDNTLVIKTDYYEFVYQTLKLIDYSAINRGSTQPLITQSDVKATNIIKPCLYIIKKYEKIISKIFEQIDYNNIQNKILKASRDTLLPKLMSGEIRVTDLQN